MKEIKGFGIDISHHQGVIDFRKLSENDQLDFIILRDGYGVNGKDRTFLTYTRACLDLGIKITGVYHFSYATSKSQAEEEARFCIHRIKESGLPTGKDFIIFFDFEGDSKKKALEKGINISNDDILEFTKAFCNIIKQNGFRPGVYMNVDYRKNVYEKDKEFLDTISIWLADYSEDDPRFECEYRQVSSKGTISGIDGNVDFDYFYGSSSKDKKDQDEIKAPNRSRKAVVQLASSWLGKNENDGSHKTVIDIYNSQSSFPRGVKMKYNWAWCACFWSAVAIKLGYTDIIPIEISCNELMKKADEMDIMTEGTSGYIPNPGDGILYDWQASLGNRKGIPDHVGIVESVDKSRMTVTAIEGNFDNCVKRRTLSLHSVFIRGYICPRYGEDGESEDYNKKNELDAIAQEAIDGLWGNDKDRRERLTIAGYDYTTVQKRINEILNGGAYNTDNDDQDQLQPYEKKVVTISLGKSYNKKNIWELQNNSKFVL